MVTLYKTAPSLSEHSKTLEHALVFSIPPRSPDLNPIENLFHLLSKQLEKDALEMEIKYEDFGQFSKRVKDTIMNFPKNTIDKIIESIHEKTRRNDHRKPRTKVEVLIK